MMKVKAHPVLSRSIAFLELNSLGIYPQLNKQAFVRDVIDIINKDLHMVC